jgi:hypothetical protein
MSDRSDSFKDLQLLLSDQELLRLNARRGTRLALPTILTLLTLLMGVSCATQSESAGEVLKTKEPIRFAYSSAENNHFSRKSFGLLIKIDDHNPDHVYRDNITLPAQTTIRVFSVQRNGPLAAIGNGPGILTGELELPSGTKFRCDSIYGFEDNFPFLLGTTKFNRDYFVEVK